MPGRQTPPNSNGALPPARLVQLLAADQLRLHLLLRAGAGRSQPAPRYFNLPCDQSGSLLKFFLDILPKIEGGLVCRLPRCSLGGSLCARMFRKGMLVLFASLPSLVDVHRRGTDAMVAHGSIHLGARHACCLHCRCIGQASQRDSFGLCYKTIPSLPLVCLAVRWVYSLCRVLGGWIGSLSEGLVITTPSALLLNSITSFL